MGYKDVTMNSGYFYTPYPPDRSAANPSLTWFELISLIFLPISMIIVFWMLVYEKARLGLHDWRTSPDRGSWNLRTKGVWADVVDCCWFLLLLPGYVLMGQKVQVLRGLMAWMRRSDSPSSSG